MSEPTTPLTPEEYAAREQRAKEAEREYVRVVQDFRERLMAALGRGELNSTFTLPTMVWLMLLDDMRDRRPRNYSAMLRDDTLDRLNAAIDRLHEEANFMVAFGPSRDVAPRFDPSVKPTRRPRKPDPGSAELQQIMRDKGWTDK